MKLSQLIETLHDNQVARAYFGGDSWYVTKSVGFIRYCNKEGTDIGEAVPLTPSNIRAEYDIITDS